MAIQTVFVSTASANLAILDIPAAAGILSEMSGADEAELARDLAGGITFECDGLTFVPDVLAGTTRTERVTRRLDAVERTPAWNGGAS